MLKKIFFFILIIALPFTADAQCSMCRAVLESNGSQETAEGINQGIVYLMMFPYLLVGGVGYVIYRNRKKKSTK